MNTQTAALDTFVTSLFGLTGYSPHRLDQISKAVGYASYAETESPRQKRNRVETWRRILQDIPLDERSYDDRFGLGSRRELISTLTPWCLKFRAQPHQHRTTYESIFGFISLFLLTLVSLDESERRRSSSPVAPQVGAKPRTEEHDCSELCEPLIAHAEVANVILQVYGPQVSQIARGAGSTVSSATNREWSWIDADTLRFHRHGSTSIILRGSTGGPVHGAQPEFALKLILYPFTRIKTIVTATREYANNYDIANAKSRHLVHVWASSTNWILMDFVDGKTLAEVMQDEMAGGSYEATGTGRSARGPASRRNAGQPRVLRLDALRDKGRRLFDALCELQEIAQDPSNQNHGSLKGIHGDLSPSNIIVAEDTAEFKLIDLGRNYLYTHTITGTDNSESSYVAPEVRSSDNDITRADLYSLGQLLIYIACGSLGQNGLVPDIFYIRAPLLARFIEDLSGAEPKHRLLIFHPAGGSGFSYATLKECFLEELAMVQASERGEEVLRAPSGWRVARELLRPLSGSPGKEWRLARMRSQQKNFRSSDQRILANWVLVWSLIATAIWAITNATVIAWLLRDLNLAWGNWLVEAIQTVSHDHSGLPIVDSWRHSDYTIPNWRENLPARLVGISYALAAPKYYMCLCAGVTPLVAGRGAGPLTRRAWATEVIMRVMAVVPCGMVVALTLIEIRWWPIGTAIGQILTYFTNLLTISFVNSTFATARSRDITTVPEDDGQITGLYSFSQWVPTSLFYAVVVTAIGVCVYFSILHDVYVYALCASATNIFIFYMIKCGIGGSSARIPIVRACLAAERLSKLKNVHSKTTSMSQAPLTPLTFRSRVRS